MEATRHLGAAAARAGTPEAWSGSSQRRPGPGAPGLNLIRDVWL